MTTASELDFVFTKRTKDSEYNYRLITESIDVVALLSEICPKCVSQVRANVLAYKLVDAKFPVKGFIQALHRERIKTREQAEKDFPLDKAKGTALLDGLLLGTVMRCKAEHGAFEL